MRAADVANAGWTLITSERTRSRIAVSFAANVMRAGVSFLTGLLVARVLGPAGYGDLNFVLASTLSITTLFDFGTSTAFFTGIARRPRSPHYLRMYGAWHAAQLLLPLVAFGWVVPNVIFRGIWAGQDRQRVLLAFAASFLVNQTWGLLSQLAESRRKTLLAQTATITQVLVHFGAVVAIAALGLLSVEHVLMLLIVEYVVLTGILAPHLVRLSVDAHAEEGWRAVLDEFVVYCSPLVIVSAAGVAYSFADRWMLQRFSGSAQQGIFSVGQQFAAIGLVLTSSLVKVFWKEIAEARERGDEQRIARLYRSVTRTLYFAVAWLCCLLIPYSREILMWTLGARFASGWICLLLMFVYPVHQALGQVQATFFFASGSTRTYSRIGILTMVISVPMTYLLLAPRANSVPGLQLGAEGLALKMVLLNWFSVGLQSKAIAGSHGWRADYGFEAAALGSLFVAGWACRWLAIAALSGIGVAAVPPRVAVGCVFYLGLTAALVYWCDMRRVLALDVHAPSVAGGVSS